MLPTQLEYFDHRESLPPPVLEYLEGVLGKEAAYNQIFDIGGPDILTYKQMLLKFASLPASPASLCALAMLAASATTTLLRFR